MQESDAGSVESLLTCQFFAQIILGLPSFWPPSPSFPSDVHLSSVLGMVNWDTSRENVGVARLSVMALGQEVPGSNPDLGSTSTWSEVGWWTRQMTKAPYSYS